MKSIYLAAALAVAGTGAQAQVLTVSTTNPGGLTHSIGSAIAKTVSEHSDLNLVVVPAGGSPMPAVAGGEAECGINVAFDLSYYVNGTEFYAEQGRHDNLQVVGAVLSSQVALYVRKDSDLDTIADLKGLRVPGGLNAQLAIGRVYDTYLDLAGLSRDDVETVPAQSIVQAANDFSSGRNDTFLFSIGAAKVLEVDSSVGGLKALKTEASADNKALLTRNLPGAVFKELSAGTSDQVSDPTNVIAYDLVLFCSADVADDTIATITRVIHDNKAGLAESFKAMNRFDPDGMAPSIPSVDYHPGALAYYEQAGLWPPKD